MKKRNSGKNRSGLGGSGSKSSFMDEKSLTGTPVGNASHLVYSQTRGQGAFEYDED